MWSLFGWKSIRQIAGSHHLDKCCLLVTLLFLLIVRLFPGNSALQNGRRCLAEVVSTYCLYYGLKAWKCRLGWRYSCVAAFAWPWAPTLTHLASAHPCPHSHGGAQCHLADAESTSSGNAVERGESSEPGFSLAMRLIYNIYYIFLYIASSAKFLAKARTPEDSWRLCCSPLAVDVGCSSELPFHRC